MLHFRISRTWVFCGILAALSLVAMLSGACNKFPTKFTSNDAETSPDSVIGVKREPKNAPDRSLRPSEKDGFQLCRTNKESDRCHDLVELRPVDMKWDQGEPKFVVHRNATYDEKMAIGEVIHSYGGTVLFFEQEVYITRELSRDLDLIWNYTNKAQDTLK